MGIFTGASDDCGASIPTILPLIESPSRDCTEIAVSRGDSTITKVQCDCTDHDALKCLSINDVAAQRRNALRDIVPLSVGSII